MTKQRAVFIFVTLFLFYCLQVFGDNSLFQAIERGDLEAVKNIIGKNKKSAAKKSFAGSTPLHLAARLGKTEIAEYLLANGAKIDEKDEEGWTPLHLAIYGGFPKTAELLLNKGANIHETCPSGTALHVAALVGHAELVNMLIAKGAKVNQKFGDKMWTPLHSAAYGGSEEVVSALISAKADVRERDADGLLPIQIAERAGHRGVMELLASKGGSPEETGSNSLEESNDNNQ